MGFVSPWILWGLAAIALPIIIHLFYFRRYKKIEFSGIQFLQELIQEQKKTNRLKDLLILLTRILAIVFLVLAFALPFIGKKDTTNHSSRKLIIYVDNSMSMRYINSNRELLDDTKSVAVNLLDDLDNEAQVMVLTHDISNSRKVFNNPLKAKEIVRQIEPTPYHFSAEDWTANVKSLMQDLHEKDLNLVWISDFQEKDLPKQWDSLFTKVNLVAVQAAQKKQNISIDSVWMLNPVVVANAHNRILVEIRNQGEAASTDLSLQIQQEAPFTKELKLSENAHIVDTLQFFLKSGNSFNGKVSVSDPNLTFDNTLYFHADIRENNKVLLIEDVGASNAIYKVFQNDDFQKVYKQSSQTSIPDEDYNLIVLNEVKTVTPENEVVIKDYVENGGNLYIIPGERNATEIYHNILEELGVGQFSEKREEQHAVFELNTKEPELSLIFEKQPQNIDLPKVNAYWTISSSYQSPESMLMSFDNGQAFISKFQVGKGVVYIQASSLHSEISDFSQKYLFAPLIYNFSIVKSNAQALYYTIGKNDLVQNISIPAGENALLKISNGQQEVIPSIVPMGQKIGLKIPSNIQADGIYELTNNDQVITTLALNYDRSESEMKFLTAKDIKAKYPQKNVKVSDEDNFQYDNLSAWTSSATQLWKICVILALIFLLIEITLIRILKK
ncbi:MAG: BatA domain-containing protein [Chitinophagales bacterium]|nr:BatA domain-containing protein [Chitinophagales bacterium]